MNNKMNKTNSNPTSTVPATPGERLRALRKSKHISLDALSEATYINKTALSRMENGQKELCISDTEKFADYFEVSPIYIAFGIKESDRDDIIDLSGLPDSDQALVRAMVENFRNKFQI